MTDNILYFVPESGTIVILDNGNKRIHRVKVTHAGKREPVPPNRGAKLLVSGPSAAWKYEAGVLSALDDHTLYAYLPEKGRFVILGKDGATKSSFGKKS